MKSLYEVSGGLGHEYITAHVCACANGERLPQFILYKGKNMYRRLMGPASTGSLFGISDSGWIDAENFIPWFKKLFVPAVQHLTATGPVFLLFECQHSHISLNLIHTANESNIIFFCLLLNCTHVLQPLDVGVFDPLRRAWRHIIKKWKIETQASRI